MPCLQNLKIRGSSKLLVAEPLEARMLFALAFAANINFQPASAPTPSGYVADVGSVYADRGNGLTYGWNADETAAALNRDTNPADAALPNDTLIQTQLPSNPNAVWEMSVPNGWYQVKVVSGDATAFNSFYAVNVEGMLAVNAAPSTNTRFIDGTVQVNVTDGKLTVSNATGATNNNVSSLQVTALTTAPKVTKVVGFNRGARDDAALIQSSINATPAGGTVVLEPRQYVLKRALQIAKAITIEGQGATFVSQGQRVPENHAIRIESRLNPVSYKWSEAIKAGQTTFAVRVSPRVLKVGDLVFLGLGQDPFDPAEEHYTNVARIVANNGTSITVDTPVTRDINQGTKLHSIRRVEALTSNVNIRNLDFQHTSTIDSDILVAIAQNVSVENVSGTFAGTVQIQDSDNLKMRNVRATLSSTAAIPARFMTAWQSGGISVTNVVVNMPDDSPFVFLESWNRQTSFDDLTINRTFAGTPGASVFFANGSSANNFADHVKINSITGVELFGTGGGVGDFRFGKVEVSGPIRAIQLSLVNDLTVNGTRYASPLHFEQEINLSAGWTDQAFPLINGSIKSVTVTTTAGAALTHAWFQSGVFSFDMAAALATGTTDFTGRRGLIGSVYPGNLIEDHPQWALKLSTAAGLPAGSKLKVIIDYYPSN